MPSPAPSAPAQPSLARLAELIHRATAPLQVPHLIYVEDDPADADSFNLGLWEIPLVAGHPLEPLTGFVAPTAWRALGLTSSARLRHLDVPSQPAVDASSTVLVPRMGPIVSVLDDGDEPWLVPDPPVGLIPDALARALRRPTPPAEVSTGSFVELTWLDRLASGVLARPSLGRSWGWMADRHPLRGAGAAPSAEELAARVEVYSAERTWTDIGYSNADLVLPAASCGPPGGTTLPAGSWFDEGSLARWVMRHLPPAEVLVPDLLSVLPPGVGDQLMTALVTEHGL